MKRITTMVGTVLAAVALAVSSALPASAASGSTTIYDAAGDQWQGDYWASASINARQASDLRQVNVTNDGSYVTITWTMGSVLPETNTSYNQQVNLTGTLSAQPLSFGVIYNGNSATITYAGTSPQCAGQFGWSRNVNNNTITLVTPLACLPNGQNLSDLRANAQVYRSTTSIVGDDGLSTSQSVPWKG